jgi:hypothetical protein
MCRGACSSTACQAAQGGIITDSDSCLSSYNIGGKPPEAGGTPAKCGEALTIRQEDNGWEGNGQARSSPPMVHVSLFTHMPKSANMSAIHL